MSEYEYLLKRQAIAEQAVRTLMMTLMEMMPSSTAERIDRLGWSWDKEIDALDAARTASQSSTDHPLARCAAARDGDCSHAQCPQLRDSEPAKTGRHCPLDTSTDQQG